ncbi:D-isomer specific 2-hydroxyacid dehydrogenase [Dipodascopsis tothii]|uniref:D-isomer specific 2-hydroxyacid dehydrogenase n=1 Tax=Dipodascopsis tothii TaxID=44089 RepID=UPI0034D01F07
MTKPLVLLFGEISHAQAEWQALSDVADIQVCESKSRAELIEDLKGKYSKVVALYRTFNSVAMSGRFDAELAPHFPDTLKYICHNGAGYDQIDVDVWTAKGVKVSNCPGSVNAATADVNMYLILGAIRDFNSAMNSLRAGKWREGAPLSNDPEGKVLGILGMGGIGRALKQRAESFGMSVQYHNRRELSAEQSGGAKYVSFDELLATSDVVSCNLPLNPHTRHIINAEAIAKMKDGVIIVNTARGAVIDEQALVDALESGKVKNVGLDVFENEPEIHPGLLSNPKAILLPHMGTLTYESQKKMEVQVIGNIRAGITSGLLNDIVPEQASLQQ